MILNLALGIDNIVRLTNIWELIYFTVIVLKSNFILLCWVNAVRIVWSWCCFVLSFLSFSFSGLALVNFDLKRQISWLLVGVVSPEWMSTLSSRRTATRRRTVRHGNTVPSSPLYIAVIDWTSFLYSQFSTNLGVLTDIIVLLSVHLDTGTGLIVSVSVSVLFLFGRWSWIRHWNVVCARNCIPHWSNISLISIAVVNILFVLRMVSSHLLLCVVLVLMFWRASVMLLRPVVIFAVLSMMSKSKVKELDFLFNFS